MFPKNSQGKIFRVVNSVLWINLLCYGYILIQVYIRSYQCGSNPSRSCWKYFTCVIISHIDKIVICGLVNIYIIGR